MEAYVGAEIFLHVIHSLSTSQPRATWRNPGALSGDLVADSAAPFLHQTQSTITLWWPPQLHHVLANPTLPHHQWNRTLGRGGGLLAVGRDK